MVSTPPNDMVNLTPQQYGQMIGYMRNFGNGFSGTAVNGDDGAVSGYNVASPIYNGAYRQLSQNGIIPRGSNLPNPMAPAAAPAAAPQTRQAMQAPPSSDQFLQQFANRGSPVTYSGGAAPSGMNANDSSILQGIYSPKKALGGFVSPGLSPQQPEHFANGGSPGSMSWATRRGSKDATHSAGLFNSPVPGRTDKLDTLVPGGSYVIPADVVSGIGEGNTMAGSAVLDKMFHTNPYGIQGQKMTPGVGVPSHRAAGGGNNGNDHVPIIAAGGEYLIHPDAVRRIGGGDIKKGHKILDHFVLHARKKTATEMNNLPGPKR